MSGVRFNALALASSSPQHPGDVPVDLTAIEQVPSLFLFLIWSHSNEQATSPPRKANQADSQPS